MKTEHTPIPWKVNSPPRLKPLHLTGNVISGNGEVITQVNSGMGRAEANAEFICRAVNAHADLLEACKLAMGTIEAFRRGMIPQDLQKHVDTERFLRVALEKAGAR